ncbi:MAG: hypothetical protein IKP68_10080 [Clostridia bacterium]|nr:hypothetical protein [Clostridia bacterium]
MRIDADVKKETKFIILGMLIMSALMHAVFLVIGKWSLGVLWSNLLVGCAMVASFFVMCLTIQKAISCGDPVKARSMATASQLGRLLALAAVVALGAYFSNITDKGGPFEFWALVPPLFFNRITVMIRGAIVRKEEAKKNPPEPESEADEQ